MKFIIKNKLIVIGIVVGAIGGYLYYYFIGCASGTCAITSKPFNSTIYGGVMGGLVASLVKKEEKENENS